MFFFISGRDTLSICRYVGSAFKLACLHLHAGTYVEWSSLLLYSQSTFGDSVKFISHANECAVDE